jgi:hypothetical protein
MILVEFGQLMSPGRGGLSAETPPGVSWDQW